MANVIITISKGLVARNILQNDFFELLKKEFVKVVIITPAADDPRFLREFSAPQVHFVAAPVQREGVVDKFFTKLYRFLIYNERTAMMARYNYHADDDQPKKWPRLKYWGARAIFQPLSKIKLIRQTLRYLDYLFLQKFLVNQYQVIIKQYKPSVVFATNLADSSEAALLKAARKNKVRTMAMCKSWDNPSKMYFRARADKMAVWSDFMKNQIKKYQDYQDKEISIIGVPQ